ncbi:class I SAM-dependent methyltransferase [Embleya hyalina]|uniref:Methyltransferase type 11 n=1 Tax=Embleya hyalina TaxID=516124 RepID=A0A401YNB0_9ACTN|nr:class I SAM-dependent methyltransferase [Embleya hyalina]GCD96102.1 methyltransferase type 11 [Embleya hyalina]
MSRGARSARRRSSRARVSGSRAAWSTKWATAASPKSRSTPHTASAAWSGTPAAVRADLLADVVGEVLGAGAGTGANLPHYRHPQRVVLTEPDAAMRRHLAARPDRCAVPAEVVPAVAEELPFADESFDVVVATLAFCSVADPARAASEIRRVLRPDGRLVVLEHVAATGRRRERQDRWDRAWSRLFASCHLTRDTVRTLKDAGFAVADVHRLPPAFKADPTAPMVTGTARRQTADVR